jgi:hypothetical protein
MNHSKQDERNVKGSLLLDLKSQNNIITAPRYSQTLQKLLSKIQNKHPAALQCLPPCGPHSSGPTECHAMAGAQMSCIQHWYCQVIFMSLDWALKGHTVTLDDDMPEAVVQLFRQQPKEIFIVAICWHVHQWESCINVCGDFSQLLQHFYPSASSNRFQLYLLFNIQNLPLSCPGTFFNILLLDRRSLCFSLTVSDRLCYL